MNAQRVGFTFVFAAALGAGAALCLYSQEAVIMVRHAEKTDDTDDPPLSAKGQERAEALAAHLAGSRVKAIYVTQYRRTALTAAPSAARLGLVPVKLHSDAIDELVRKMRTEHPGDVVLYVGHNNSVGKIAKAYGHPEAFVLDHKEYDNLFVLVPRPGRPPALLRLKF